MSDYSSWDITRRTLIGAFLATATSCRASSFEDASSNWTDARRPLRGINVCVPFGYAATDEAGNYASKPYGDRNAFSAFLPAARCELIKRTGFDFVRLAVDVAPMLGSSDDVVDDVVDQLFSAVGILVSSGLRVLVNPCPAAWNHLVVDWQAPRILDGVSGDKFRRFTAVITRLAREIRSRYAASQVALGLFNEPPQVEDLRSGVSWYPLCRRLFAEVRSVLPEHTIVVSSTNEASIDRLIEEFSASDFDGNTLFDVHFYEPWLHSLQNLGPAFGASYESNPVGHLPPITFPPRIQQGGMAAVLKGMQVLVDADTRLSTWRRLMRKRALTNRIEEYFSVPQDEAFVSRRFDRLVRWQKAQNLKPSQIVVGEFGVSGDHPTNRFWKGATPTSQAAGIRATFDVVQAASFHWAVFELGHPWTTMSVSDVSLPYSFRSDILAALRLNF